MVERSGIKGVLLRSKESASIAG